MKYAFSHTARLLFASIKQIFDIHRDVIILMKIKYSDSD